MLKNVVNPVNIIADCDEILCNITPTWVKKMLADKEKFNHFFNLDMFEGKTDEEIYNMSMERSIFYINLWLKREGIQPTTEDIDNFFDLYDCESFYTEVEPTDMAITLTRLAYTNLVNKIYVVTRCSDKNLQIKKEFIESIIPKSKLEIIVVKSGEKKSDYVNSINMTDGILLDDELSNIHDYLDNCPNMTKMNFYVPLLGYNQPDQDLLDKCKEREIEIIYYPIERKIKKEEV